MSAPPKTVLTAAPQEAEAIRRTVRTVDPATLGPGRFLAGPEHVAGLLALLVDPAVSEALYDLPRPFTLASVAGWVEAGREARAAGEGLLFVNLDAEGEVAGYSRITVWPDLASGELGGAMRADRQGQGQGAAGAMRAFEWMFETLGLRLIGMTAAPDDVRSARLIEAAGFTRMGERESRRPDGAVQPPLYWEMARDAWRAWTGGRS